MQPAHGTSDRFQPAVRKVGRRGTCCCSRRTSGRQYVGEQRALDEQLAAQYQELIDKLEASMSDYLGVLERAFSPDVEVALLGSVELALELGVASEEVLNSDEKVLAYFLN